MNEQNTLPEGPSGPAIPVPLDKPPSFHYALLDRIILRRGTELQKYQQSGGKIDWQGISDKGFRSLSPDLVETLVSEGITLVGIYSMGELFWFITPQGDRPVLELQLQNLEQDTYHFAGKFALPARNLVYITGAVLHHFRNLGKLYSEILRSSFGIPPFGENFRDRVVLSRQIEPYYEVEALITAIIRTYETARYILWSAFSTGKDTPTNFEDVLTHANLRMPETLNAKVQMWLKTYKEVKHYRDCIQHNAHFGARLPFSMGVRKDGLWGLLVRLPDNPETKSYNSFTFNREIDALKYGWDETNNIVNFVATLFQDIKTKSQET